VASVLVVNKASKRYGAFVALQPVSFELAGGEVLAVVGSNGAGKTTLIKSIMGLIRCDGSIRINGIDIRKNGKAARRFAGYLPQNPAFHGDMTVSETAAFYGQLRKVGASEAQVAIEAVGLMEHADKPVGALSGGMRQRLGLAVARLGEPKLLILDEPTSGLDPTARREFRQLVREEREAGRTVVLSTHWLEDIPLMADHVLALKDGHTQYFGSASGFASDSGSRLLLRLNGHSAAATPTIRMALGEGAITREGEWLAVECPAADRGRVVGALAAAGINILDLRVEPISPTVRVPGGES
jgi:ABC-type multidrug transport system ATPase subunit